ncbi:MAG: hypothetical protein J7M08_05055 [Planctomycetes bacterium]|nr:hypothetical protein [Planctomycetota bacterium]
MDGRWRTKALLVLGLVALGSLAAALFLGGKDYSRKETVPESPEVKESLEVIGRMLARPEQTAQCLARDASARARFACEALARQMSEAEVMGHSESAWVGQYLNLSVEFRLPNGQAVEKNFYLKKQEGRMRITGVQ